ANGQPDLTSSVAVPGDLSAVRSDGTQVMLAGYGAAEFRLFDSITGAALQVAANHHVTLQFQLFQPPPKGLVGWSFDEQAGRWKEAGPGTLTRVNVGGLVVPDGGSPPDGGIGGIDYDVFQMVVPHLGWWASATSIPRPTCVHGT